ncbi:sulfocyanin-like copper-binding protein [Alicyclobacillus fructus]|uniref:sulfocyanin-like copper-binding protein n=1 Tax=Alicyclobacillus fructus TaxID=2816082 RepID=UPI001A8FB7D7|nr:sulfocyanin-like copper-binding protein [Alicyclobacillus fructus]
MLCCLAALGTAAFAAGCGVSTPSSSESPSDLVTWDAKQHRVEWTVIAGDGSANGGMNFDGYANGEMTLVVPVGWSVSMKFQNASLTPHSAMVVPEKDRARASFDASLLAFPGAETPNPSQGSPKGTQVDVVFTVSRPGTYALVCGVPGHALAGMWDKLEVSPQAKTPSLIVHGTS